MLAREDDLQDLRNASVARLARRFDVDKNHADTVANVAERLFEKICADINFAPNEYQISAQKLRWAAQLHEIGSMISPIDAHLHGAYILEHTEPLGFSLSELHRLSILISGYRGKLKRIEADFSDRMFVKQLVCLRLAAILCHARTSPNMRGLQLHCINNTITLTTPKTWAEKFPQSHYLLDEETLTWQKTNWTFRLNPC